MPEKIPVEDIPTRKTARKIFKSEKAKERAEQKDYIPLVEAKQTIEVSVKPKLEKKEIETIEPKKRSSKTKKGKLSGNSILIITEKPQAASKISAALSEGRARQLKSGISTYEFNKDGENIIVTCAVGHLFSLGQNIKGSDYPIYDISWKPNFEVRKKDFTKKYYSNIKKLIKRAKEIIVATDYDVEGEVIGHNIIKYIANQKDAKRMKFSSLTAKDLEQAYKTIQPNINWGQAIAGETRHYLDWFYGINLSRALMASIKTTGRFKIMSIGRVQGPALNLIVNKEREIQAFKPEPFWKIFLDLEEKEDKTNKVQVKHIKDIKKESDLQQFKDLKDKEAKVSTKKTLQIHEPPHPFDLTTLQTESYKFFSFTPSRTLQIAQKLYLAGVISYPRTSSQKIPETINPQHILKRLSEKYEKLTSKITRTKPVEGKKSDPAHPSIYPTGEFQVLGEDEKKVYELIVKRFIACFCSEAKVENKTITAEINKLKFRARGQEVKERGWMEVYTTKLKEKELRDMNGLADIKKVIIEKDQTKPPKRFSPASIVSELEKHGLGTKATRASIVETLYNRNYISDNKSMKATPLGMRLIESLEKHSPIIIDENLTRNIEQDMEKMQSENKKDKLEQEQTRVVESSKELLDKISKDFHKNEKAIGKNLVKANEELWKQEAEENQLTLCPSCKKGHLTIKYSPKFKRKFIACDAYPKCKTTFSLPPKGNIKKTDKTCEKCGFPILMSLLRGKKPWFFCFNPECLSRQEQEQRKQERAEQKEKTQDKEQ
jgi:DNA topoisomerase-1